MYVTTTNRTTNPGWHIAHSIRQAVKGMDSLAKEAALLRIKAELFIGETPDPEILNYVTALLNGRKPVGINHPQQPQEV